MIAVNAQHTNCPAGALRGGHLHPGHDRRSPPAMRSRSSSPDRVIRRSHPHPLRLENIRPMRRRVLRLTAALACATHAGGGRRRAGGGNRSRARRVMPGRGRGMPVLIGLDHRDARRRRASLPRGGRRRHVRQRLRRRPALLRRAEVHRRRAVPRPVGLLRRRSRPVRADRRPRDRRRRERLRRRLRAQPDREVRTLRRIHQGLGPLRQRTRPVQLRLLPELDPAARRRDRRLRQLRVRRRLAATTGSSASTSKAAKRSNGAPTGRAAASSPTRAASRRTRPRCSSPTTTTIASRNSPPPASSKALTGSEGTTGDRFGFPYGIALDAAGNVYVADDINHRVVKLNPQLDFVSEWGGFGSKPGQLAFPARARLGPRRRHLRRRHRQRSRPGVRPRRPLPAHHRRLRARARPADRTARARDRPDRPAVRLRHGRQLASRCSRRTPTPSPASSPPRAGTRPASTAQPASPSTRAARSTSPTPPTGGSSRFWGDGTYLSELGGPADVGGAGLSEAGSVAVAVELGRSLRGRHQPQPDPRLLPRRHSCSRASAPTAATGPPAPGRANSTTPRRSPSTARATCTSPTRTTTESSSSPPPAPCSHSGARAEPADGRFHSPTGIALDAAGNVYVVDSENNRVEVFDSSGHFLEKWGERGIGPGEFSQPTAIAVDCDGDVYVADTNNNRVERFNPSPRPALVVWRRAVAAAAGRRAGARTSACPGPRACSRGARSR